MRRERRDYLRSTFDAKHRQPQDFSEDEIDYASAPPYIQEIMDRILAERRAYHAYMSATYPTYAARLNGTYKPPCLENAE